MLFPRIPYFFLWKLVSINQKLERRINNIITKKKKNESNSQVTFITNRMTISHTQKGNTRKKKIILAKVHAK